MNYAKRIKELKDELRAIKVKQHNKCMNKMADKFQKENVLSETKAEERFYKVALSKKLKLEKQYRIDIVRKEDKKILRFYFADFCDIKHKLIFEVDGEYHFTKEQEKKDLKRTRDLNKLGYIVFRITNKQVALGKTTQFLIECYKRIGISI